ncbi:MAG: Formate/nitrite transporter-domain-containing protein, partial [Monoraphidium minutum]
MTSRRTTRVAGDHDDPTNAFPVPRFPPAHTSAAFEAMAIRKSLILTPPEIYAECAHHGEEKSQFGALKLLTLCVIAGCYVGFGYTLSLMVGGNLGADILEARPGLFSLVYGAIGFPAAFTMIVICGAELFTSMCAYMAAAWWEGKVTWKACVRMWVVTWCGNFAGCAIFLGLIYTTGIFEDGREWYALIMATKKVSHGFGNTLVRGIFANWLVGIATWQANAAQDLSGKAIGIWLPISAFAMLGWEHSIANMYLLPLTMVLEPGHLTAYEVIVGNLIPATIGNWIGGAVCVATVYAFAYGRPNVAVTRRVEGVRLRWAARRRPLPL